MRIFLVVLLFCSGVRADMPEVDKLFAAFEGEGVLGASVVIIKNGAVAYQQAYGTRELETESSVTTRTNYRLASLTKAFTAMAVMILVEQGRLHYGDTLTELQRHALSSG